jgi:hypothetical protein
MKKLLNPSLCKGPSLTRRLAALFLGLVVAVGGGSAALAADEAAPPAARLPSVPLAADAPASYVVQRGDTLWGISSRFLREPWNWPEIWYLNPDVKNPHLIYPGDTLRLVYGSDGRPQIRVERGEVVQLSPQVRATPLDQAIPAIPYELVAAFMSKPSVVSKEDARRLPYVVAQYQERVIAGTGDGFYARGLEGAQLGERFNVVHLGDRLRDPDGGGELGYVGIHAGSARLERAATGQGANELAKLTLVESARETLNGDLLVRDKLEVPLDFVPHAPSKPVDGRVISVVNGISVIGQYHVVVINRGREHGLEPGHVLSVWQRGDKVKDRGPGGTSNEFTKPFTANVTLPEERAGTFMVFKAYDRLSYGLIMSATAELHVGDLVRKP